LTVPPHNYSLPRSSSAANESRLTAVVGARGVVVDAGLDADAEGIGRNVRRFLVAWSSPFMSVHSRCV
jgi:hypothetical protein